MRFTDIPQYNRKANCRIDVSWHFLEQTIAGYAEDARLWKTTFEMDPDFQRGHVWRNIKQVRYVEYVLRGGVGARDIFFNCTGGRSDSSECGRFVLVDGKQRLEAVRAFLRGDFRVFGHHFGEFSGRLPMNASFSVNLTSLATDADVLQWYLDMNDGGVARPKEELDRVREMLYPAA